MASSRSGYFRGSHGRCAGFEGGCEAVEDVPTLLVVGRPLHSASAPEIDHRLEIAAETTLAELLP